MNEEAWGIPFVTGVKSAREHRSRYRSCSLAETRERNWLPLVIAAAVVLIVAAVVILVMQHGREPATVTPVSAPPDPMRQAFPYPDWR